MPSAFLTRYYDEIDLNLNDPSMTKRLTKAQKLQLLHTIEKQVWERLLTGTGQESMLGLTETGLNVVAGTDTYALPGNFRQFVAFEKRATDARDQIEKRLRSIPYYAEESGVVILSGYRGMRIKPVPTLSETWALVYQKGPIVHFCANLAAGNIGDVSSGAFVLVTPAVTPIEGEIVRGENYYVGSLIRVYDQSAQSTNPFGHPQVKEVDTFTASSGNFEFRDAWSPALEANAKIETVPTLPEGLDSIYALDAAIKILARRGKVNHRRELIEQRAELWNACKNWAYDLVADRGPTRTMPLDMDEPDTGYENYTDLL